MLEKEYQDEISALNALLLEQKDQINALGAERNKWKEIAISAIKLISVMDTALVKCREVADIDANTALEIFTLKGQIGLIDES